MNYAIAQLAESIEGCRAARVVRAKAARADDRARPATSLGPAIAAVRRR
jgi:hypothetical protein